MLNRIARPPDEGWRAVADRLAGEPGVVLAVSGGPDSLAMLAGFAALSRAGVRLPTLAVATVDHGLRPQSAGEASAVAALCTRLGLDHSILALPPYPAGGNVQAWARNERYRVLGQLAGLRCVVTAHTADDQAETFLMRAARGTGADGLAGIAETGTVQGARLVRPFLAWPRVRLHAALADMNHPGPNGHVGLPVDDPGNQDARFTRVRFRAWLAKAPLPDGARSIVEGLSASARIAALERDGLEMLAGRAFETLLAQGTSGDGFVRGHVGLAEEPAALSARLLRRILLHVARCASARRFDLARLVALAERMGAEARGSFVLAGARLDWHCAAGVHHLHAFAEAGRDGFPVLALAPGEQGVWDGRFAVCNGSSHRVVVRAWRRGEEDGLADLPGRVRASLPVCVALTSGDRVDAGEPAVCTGQVEGVSLTFLAPAERCQPANGPPCDEIA